MACCGKGRRSRSETISPRAFGINLIYADARQRFLDRLARRHDPERSARSSERSLCGFLKNMRMISRGDQFLAQGTLYPDVIESGGSKKSVTIKTHHNVGGLPDDMTLKVIEPLRELFKDEARAVAAELGLPDTIVWRHPFPGPGLAIRILGEVTAERLAMLQEADAIFIAELRSQRPLSGIWPGADRSGPDPERGRHGRSAYLRPSDHSARCDDGRFHDGHLGATAL